MPPEARVAIIEDVPDLRFHYTFALEEHGHEVVAEAGTLAEARALVHTLGEIEVNVVLLDGNLSNDQNDGSEGRMLADAIKRDYPDTKIIGITSDPNGVNGVDKNVYKSGVMIGGVDLGKIVTEI